MKILHTADTHLKEHGDQRWIALEEILKIGEKEKIDLMVVSGDLFDKNTDAEKLRLHIRNIFSHTNFDIIIVSGNHDFNSYKDYMDFGDNVKIIKEINSPLQYKDVVIWGIPFKEGMDQKDMALTLFSLKEKIKPGKINILVLHCELILERSFSEEDFGNEGGINYMPVKLSSFNKLNFNYILAGHFHSKFNSFKLGNGGYFVYPGSPISITKKEKGKRAVNIFEVGKSPQHFHLNTPFYEDVTIELNPFDNKNPIEMIKKKLNNISSNAIPLITVKGFINGEKIGMGEKKLKEEINKIIKNIKKKINLWEEDSFVSKILDVREILEDDLFIRFNKKLEQKEYPNEDKKNIKEIVIEAMINKKAYENS